MIFLVQFGINEHLKIFSDYNYLFQIALKFMWLPILTTFFISIAMI